MKRITPLKPAANLRHLWTGVSLQTVARLRATRGLAISMGAAIALGAPLCLSKPAVAQSNSSISFTLESPPPARITNPTLRPPDFNHLTVQAIGMVTADGAQIERREGASGVQVLFTCLRGQSLGVLGQLGNWYCVLMADGSVGCILSARVQITWDRPSDVPDLPGGGRGTAEVIFPNGGHAPGSPLGLRVVDDAMQYLGVRYHWGGNGFSGIDCSGLVKAVFSKEGLDLPRTAREQAGVGSQVDLANAQAGDRLSFCCHGRYIDHTGIYIGNGQFIHACGSKGEVCVSRLEGSYLHWLVGIHRDYRQG